MRCISSGILMLCPYDMAVRLPVPYFGDSIVVEMFVCDQYEVSFQIVLVACVWVYVDNLSVFGYNTDAGLSHIKQMHCCCDRVLILLLDATLLIATSGKDCGKDGQEQGSQHILYFHYIHTKSH